MLYIFPCSYFLASICFPNVIFLLPSNLGSSEVEGVFHNKRNLYLFSEHGFASCKLLLSLWNNVSPEPCKISRQ